MGGQSSKRECSPSWKRELANKIKGDRQAEVGGKVCPVCQEAPVKPYRGRGQVPKYCSKTCNRRAWRRRNGKVCYRRARRKATTPVGRQCKWCQAWDHEAVWYRATHECEPCARQRLRNPCSDCGGPVSSKHPKDCPRCNPPAWLAPVLIIDTETERERTVYRSPLYRIYSKSYYLSVGGKEHRQEEDELTVVVLPSDVWVRTRY